MATPNFRPNASNEGQIGTSAYPWSQVNAQTINEAGNRVATLASPTFTGTPAAPTAAGGTNTTQIATTAYVQTELVARAKFSGALVVGNLAKIKGTNELEDTGSSLADVLARANHTGTQAQSTITDLVADLATITADIATNVSAIAALPGASHTHTSADITDATSAATASKVVVRDAAGAALFAATTGVAATGTSSGSGGTGLHGQSNGASGFGVTGTGASTSGGGQFTAVNVAATSLVAIQTAAAAPILSARYSADPIMVVYTDSKIRLYNSAGTFYSALDFGTITANRTVTWPDATGTVVFGDGTGVTDADSFRNNLGIRSTDNVTFGSVGTLGGGNHFWGSATLALNDPASTTDFLLPSGGGATEQLVDGDGRGVTDPAAFRTAIGAAAATSPAFTTTVAINPSSGSEVLALTGALGFTSTISANPSAARAISFPNAAGTLAVVASATGAIVATEISDSTATGQAVMTAANAAAGLAALGGISTVASTDITDSTATGRALLVAANAAAARVAAGSPIASDRGYFEAVGDSSSPLATTGVSGTPVACDPGTAGMGLNVGTGFTATGTTDTKVRYDGATTTNFLVTAVISFITATAGDVIAFTLGKNGSAIAASEKSIVGHTDERQVTVQYIVSLANLDTVEVMGENETASRDFTLNHVSISGVPLI